MSTGPSQAFSTGDWSYSVSPIVQSFSLNAHVCMCEYVSVCLCVCTDSSPRDDEDSSHGEDQRAGTCTG